MHNYLSMSQEFLFLIDRGLLLYFGPLGFHRFFHFVSFSLHLLPNRYLGHSLLYLLFIPLVLLLPYSFSYLL